MDAQRLTGLTTAEALQRLETVGPNEITTGGGRTLGYSADTAFDPGLIAWLAEADLFIHETNYGVHTPYASLAALPADLRARMRLIHYPDAFDLAHSTIEPLEERRVYPV